MYTSYDTMYSSCLLYPLSLSLNNELNLGLVCSIAIKYDKKLVLYAFIIETDVLFVNYEFLFVKYELFLFLKITLYYETNRCKN